MADFSTLGLGQRWLGGTVSNSRGVTVNPNATADTKGSFAQLISAANNKVETTGVLVTMGGTQAGASYLVDIAVGAAASEVVVVSNLISKNFFSGKPIYNYFIPISIPSGVRVAARSQSDQASAGAVQVTLNLMGQGFLPSSPLQRVTPYGIATSGTYPTVAAANTTTANAKNATWTEVTSSTTNPCGFLMIAVVGAAANATQTVQWLFDVGVGAAGSETTLIPNLSAQQSFISGSDYYMSPMNYLLPVSIPAGTRLSTRSQASVTTSGERDLFVGFYGID